jgi:hypothetical protein
MTAILNIDALRTHAVSMTESMEADHASDPNWYDQLPLPRAVLMMCWRSMPDGRLTCRWRTDISAAFGLPPD